MWAFMGLGRNTPICALEGDLGWAPLVIYTKCEVVKLWHQICTLPATRITRKVFDWLSSRVSIGKGNWVSRNHQLLHTIDLPLNSVNCNNRRQIADLAWDSLAAIYTDKWEKEVCDIKAVQSTSGGRLSVYRALKPNPGTENYDRTPSSECPESCSGSQDGIPTS